MNKNTDRRFGNVRENKGSKLAPPQKCSENIEMRECGSYLVGHRFSALQNEIARHVLLGKRKEIARKMIEKFSPQWMLVHREGNQTLGERRYHQLLCLRIPRPECKVVSRFRNRKDVLAHSGAGRRRGKRNGILPTADKEKCRRNEMGLLKNIKSKHAQERLNNTHFRFRFLSFIFRISSSEK